MSVRTCAGCAACPCGMEHDCTDECHPDGPCAPFPPEDGQVHDQAQALALFLDARRDVAGAVACLLATPVDLEGFRAIMGNGSRANMAHCAIGMLAEACRQTGMDVPRFREWAGVDG